jgi:hypothetical protein
MSIEGSDASMFSASPGPQTLVGLIESRQCRDAGGFFVLHGMAKGSATGSATKLGHGLGHWQPAARRAARAGCVVAMMGVLVACRDRADSQGAPAAAPARPVQRLIVADVIVLVENPSPAPMFIAVDVRGASLPIGQVKGGSTQSFSLPSSAGDTTGELHLQARRTNAAVTLQSESFRIASGHQVTWRLDGSPRGTLTMR